MYSRLEMPFWDWILLHRHVLCSGDIRLKTVSKEFKVPLKDINTDRGVGSVIGQIDLAEVRRLAGKASVNLLDVLKADETFQEVSMFEILHALMSLSGFSDIDY